MENLRTKVMELINDLEGEMVNQQDPRVKKALKRALANLNRLFGVLLVL